MKLILWDWNGTLLDDVDASIIALNILLSRRSMAGIDKPTYKRIFRFPVIENYRKLGFNLEVENFDDVAREYVAEYMNSSKDVGLFPSATSVLDYVHAKGYTQSIISAMPQSHLIGQIIEWYWNYFNILFIACVNRFLDKTRIDYGEAALFKSRKEFGG